MPQHTGSAPQRVARTVPETAERLGLGESTVWRLIHNRQLRAVKIGRSTRCIDSDIDAFVAGLPEIGQAA